MDPTGRLAEIHVEKMIRRMGFDWRQQTDKSRGVDGLIEIYRNRRPTARFIFAQVKSGVAYLGSSKSAEYCSIRVDPEDVAYWRTFNVPIILIWYDDKADRAYWGPIDVTSVSPGGSRIKLSKRSVLGLHSAGDLYQLCRTFYGIESQLPSIVAPAGPKIRVASIKLDAKAHYDAWRKEIFTTPAFGLVRVSLRGWRHITSTRRTQRDVVRKLELLGVAREILLTVPTKHKCRELKEEQRTFYIQTGIVRHLHRSDAVVSVIVEQFDGDLPTFYSVTEHRSRPTGGEAIHRGLLGATAG